MAAVTTTRLKTYHIVTFEFPLVLLRTTNSFVMRQL